MYLSAQVKHEQFKLESERAGLQLYPRNNCVSVVVFLSCIRSRKQPQRCSDAVAMAAQFVVQSQEGEVLRRIHAQVLAAIICN